MHPSPDLSTTAAGPSRAFKFSESPAEPRPVLTTDQAVEEWHSTPGFRAFWAWTTHKCDRIKGKEIMRDRSVYPSIDAWMELLGSMMQWVEEVPPHPQSNQRFGNLAFRDYIKLVESRLPVRLRSFPGNTPALVDQILPLLIQSTAFGQPTRLDYGSGHELAFVLALWSCVVAGFVEGEEEEDELVLRVFPRYLDLVTLLQKTYRLEPAGSHGVWGLDDYCFFPYLFGSAQLLDSSMTPSKVLQLANTATDTDRISDLYTLSLHRIKLFKSGASFAEHSPLLHQLSTFPDWKKPHMGLRKMFMGEVVGKRVVVQGIWLGGWTWGEDVPGEKPDAGGAAGRVKVVIGTENPGTAAPWTKGDGRMRTLEATRGDWAGPAPRRT